MAPLPPVPEVSKLGVVYVGRALHVVAIGLC